MSSGKMRSYRPRGAKDATIAAKLASSESVVKINGKSGERKSTISTTRSSSTKKRKLQSTSSPDFATNLDNATPESRSTCTSFSSNNKTSVCRSRQKKKKKKKNGAKKQKVKSRDWRCESCSTQNSFRRKKCKSCSIQRGVLIPSVNNGDDRGSDPNNNIENVEDESMMFEVASFAFKVAREEDHVKFLYDHRNAANGVLKSNVNDVPSTPGNAGKKVDVDAGAGVEKKDDSSAIVFPIEEGVGEIVSSVSASLNHPSGIEEGSTTAMDITNKAAQQNDANTDEASTTTTSIGEEVAAVAENDVVTEDVTNGCIAGCGVRSDDGADNVNEIQIEECTDNINGGGEEEEDPSALFLMMTQAPFGSQTLYSQFSQSKTDVHPRDHDHDPDACNNKELVSPQFVRIDKRRQSRDLEPEKEIATEPIRRTDVDVSNNDTCLKSVPMFFTAGKRTHIEVTADALENAARLFRSDDDNSLNPIARGSASDHSDGSGEMLNYAMNSDVAACGASPLLQSSTVQKNSDSAIQVSPENLDQSSKVLSDRSNDQCILEPKRKDASHGSNPITSESDSQLIRHPMDYTNSAIGLSEAQPENDDSHPRYPATFATAGTKTAIKVSDDALRKASNLIIAVDRTLPATRRDGITKSRNQRKCSAEANLPSFVTAGKGSQIRVSAEALKSVSEYFDDDFSVAGFRSSGVVLVEKTNYVASDEERKLHSLNSVSVIDNSLSVQPFVSVGKSLNTEVSAEASPVVGIERERDIDWSSVGAPVDVLAPMFTTAGKGAKIKVSAEALHRATKVLGDSAAGKNNPSSSIHNKVSVSGAVKQSYSSTVERRKDSTQASGASVVERFHPAATFSTAGSKTPIHVSDSALKEAGKIMGSTFDVSKRTSKLCVEQNKKTCDTRKAPANNIRPKATLPMFKTAGKGANIDISDEALKKASTILGNANESTRKATRMEPIVKRKVVRNPYTSKKRRVQSVAALKTSIVSSTSRKATYLCNGALQKGVQIIAESTSDSADHLISQTIGTSAATRNLPVFTTAGKGDRLEVSPEALKNVTKMFDDCPAAAAPVLVTKQNTMAPKLSMNSFIRSNSTPSPLDAMTKLDSNSRSGSMSNVQMVGKAPSIGVGGIQQQGLDILANDEGFAAGAYECEKRSTASVQYPSFSTAGKRVKIQVSGEALRKASRFFGENSCTETIDRLKDARPKEDEQPSGSPEQNKISARDSSNQNDAKTADEIGNPIIAIQPASQDGSKLLGSGNENEQCLKSFGDLNMPKNSDGAMSGFATAGKGKRIQVSEEALKKASNMLNGDDGRIESSEQSVANSSVNIYSPSSSAPLLPERSIDSAPSKSSPEGDKDQHTSVFNHTSSLTTAGSGVITSVPNDVLEIFDTSEIGVSSETNKTSHRPLHISAQNSRRIVPPTNSHVPMFATAGKGAKIHVSAEALANASKMMSKSNTEGESADFGNTRKIEKTTNLHLGQTTRGRPGARFDSGKAVKQSPGVSMFSTAGTGSNIQVSARALEQASKLLGENASSPMQGLGSSDSNKDCDMEVQRNMYPISEKKHASVANELSNHPNEMNFEETKQTQSPGALLVSKQYRRHVQQSNAISLTPGPRLSRSQAMCSSNYSKTSASSSIALAAVTPMIIGRGSSSGLGSSQYRSQDNKLTVHFQNESNASNSSAEANNHSITTPLNPTRRSAKVVTRSTIKNPYAKPFAAKTRTAISPVPFKFHHLSGKFSGKTISPRSMKKAAEILSDSPRTRQHRIQSSFSKPRMLDYSNTIVAKRPLETQKNTSLTLKEFVEKYKLTLPDNHHIIGTTETIPIIFQINSGNASSLQFGDDGLPSSIGSSETDNASGMHSQLIRNGCDAALLTKKWVVNHTRWIVWKLAATERSFPTKLSGYLCRSRVLEQLQARYTKEIQKSKRSAVRKFLNRDESSSRLMILCVSRVLEMPTLCESTSSSGVEGANVPEASSTSTIVELTDGWYPVRAVLDRHLSSFVSQNRIRVGTKLAICNALLHGCEDGIDPLDDGYSTISGSSCSVYLKIHVNGTKLARWNAKLGFCEQSCMRATTLMGATLGGGSIPCMDVIIVRRYPILYLDKTAKESKSKILTRSQEDEAQRKYESLRQRKMEEAAEQVQIECQEEVEDQAPRIWKQMMVAPDVADFYENVDSENKRIIDSWREKRVALIQRLKQKSVDDTLRDEDFPVRASTPFVKVKVTAFQRFGTRGKFQPLEKMAMFTLWRVTDCQYNVLKEGSVIRMRDVIAKEKNHDGLVQLSSTTKTKFFSLPYTSATDPLVGYMKRKFISIGRMYIKSKAGNQSRSNEVDFMGCLVKTSCERSSSCTCVKAYFADESALLVRVERQFENHIEATQWKLLNKSQEREVFAFNDVRVMPFDSIEGCPVVSWTKSSIIGRNCLDRERSIKRWTTTEPATFAQMKGLMDVGLFAKKSSPSHVSVVIGYISGVTYQSNTKDPEKCVTFQIDDSVAIKHVLCSLADANGMHKIIFCDTFDQNEEKANDKSTKFTGMGASDDTADGHAVMESIAHSLEMSGILFQFTVEQDEGADCFRLLHVKRADTKALADLLVRSSLCSKEDDRINGKRKRA